MNDKEAVEALVAHRIRFMDDFGWDKSTSEALDIAIASLATESKPVVKGKWIPDKYDPEFKLWCSACNWTAEYPYNFCPNCGADMREEKQDEDDRSNNKN